MSAPADHRPSARGGTTPPVLLMPGPMTEHVMQACAEHFDVIRLWECRDPDAELRQRGGSVAAITTAGQPVGDDLMGRLPNLEIVSSFGVGYDSIDVRAAARRRVVVTNTPDVLTDDVADVAVGLLLMAVREMPQAERYLREGRWTREPYRLAPTRLRGRKLGILGLGRIGEAIARRVQPCGVEISYHNRRPRDVPYRYCPSVAELAEQVDTLVVAAPGGPETRHLVDADLLARLGTRGVVVNVARGSVVDEAALINALRSGVIQGAGLDVFEDEPRVPPALLALPNVAVLPHIGSATVETRRAMGQLVIDNLVHWFESGTALTPVPAPPPVARAAPPGIHEEPTPRADTAMRRFDESARLYGAACEVIAGGVSSDIRRSTSSMPPLYIDSARGSRMWDVDGNEYVDYVLGQGPLLFGHSHPRIVDAVTAQVARGQVYSAQHRLEVEVAQLVCELVPCAELVRFNSVGSEAVHAAWRLARAVTGRTKILKFEGHYHGWYDPAWFSVHPSPDEAGPADRPRPVPNSLGQLPSAADELVVAPWNDLAACERILDEHAGQIAAVVMEPLLCNTGCIEPVAGFLQGVRERTRRDGIVLIFDEVITGFRLAPGGAQQWYDVVPDLAVFGKAMAGGFPLSCIAGSEDVMRPIATGVVGHAGTFNSNPVVMAAAAAALGMIREEGDALYQPLRERGRRLVDGIAQRAAAAGVEMLTSGPGPVAQTYYTSRSAVGNYRDFAEVDRERTRRFHSALLAEGINSVGRGLWFLSTAHDDEDIDRTLAAVERAFDSSWWYGGPV